MLLLYNIQLEFYHYCFVVQHASDCVEEADSLKFDPDRCFHEHISTCISKSHGSLSSLFSYNLHIWSHIYAHGN